MSQIDSNKYFLRFLESADEVPSNKKPIPPFQKMTVISFEKTLEPIRKFMLHIGSIICKAKNAATQWKNETKFTKD